MRIQITYENKIGLTTNLLQLFVKHHLDLINIECDVDNVIYIKLAEIDFNHFNSLINEIRLLDGVSDVSRVAYIPSELQKNTITILLNSLKEAAICVDHKGYLTWANNEALILLKLSAENYRKQSIYTVIQDDALFQLIEQHQLDNPAKHLQTSVIIHQQLYQLSIHSLFVDCNYEQQIPGAVIFITPKNEEMKQNEQSHLSGEQAFNHICAESPAMQQLVEKTRTCALLDVPLLIVGETGSGKDIIAKACHNFGKRREQPFLAINCAALPDEVVESELYGHAAGAYPNALYGKKGFFEQANGGSVLLDEIGEMSARMQTKLLRFLNDGRFRRVGEDQEVYVNVRIICSTKCDLLALVNKGTFREDLYYRLNVLTLDVPSLRQRQLDIMPLTQSFVEEYATQLAIPKPDISPELSQVLLQYSWPGNVRQLRNVIYRAMMQLDGQLLEAKHIVLSNDNEELGFNDYMMEGSLDEINKRFERSVLMHFYQTYPSTRKLAKRLGISHTAIANKLREYGLTTAKHE